jgi:hypothetical protein
MKEFTDMISENDLIMLSETKTSDVNEHIVCEMLDNINYKAKFKNRPVSTNQRSGGIGVICKKNIFD